MEERKGNDKDEEGDTPGKDAMTRTTWERYLRRCLAIIDLPLARRRWMTLLNMSAETLPLRLFFFCFTILFFFLLIFHNFFPSTTSLLYLSFYYIPLLENNIKTEFSHSKKLLSSFTNFLSVYLEHFQAFNLIARVYENNNKKKPLFWQIIKQDLNF